jgi:hypothetical protein
MSTQSQWRHIQPVDWRVIENRWGVGYDDQALEAVLTLARSTFNSSCVRWADWRSSSDAIRDITKANLIPVAQGTYWPTPAFKALGSVR